MILAAGHGLGKNEGSSILGYSIIIEDTSLVDESAIYLCTPGQKLCLPHHVTLVYGSMQKITENVRRFTTEYGNSANPP